MITVQEAENLISQCRLTLKTEQVPLMSAGGRRLGEDLNADRDFPPFDRVTMDGIAIKYEGWQKTGGEFEVKGVQAAGTSALSISESHHCLEVMTGAVLPQGADTVIPYEHLEQSTNGQVMVTIEPKAGQNVHRQGTDRQAGQTIVKAGTIIGAPEIGIAATVGKAQLQVQESPKVAIVSTGDELVEVSETPLPHQIRSSNAPTMQHALQRWQIDAKRYHIIDDLPGTISKLQELLSQYHVLLLSGGVSKGKFDHVPAALEKLQVTKHFHRISQRPGKPFWFGSHANGCQVFAFPGNPVSSFMCFNRYFKPWMDQQLSIRNAAAHAILMEPVTFVPDLTYFAQVRVDRVAAGLQAWPVEGHGSGDLANLVDADGFIELPKGKDLFQAGESYALFLYRDL